MSNFFLIIRNYLSITNSEEFNEVKRWDEKMHKIAKKITDNGWLDLIIMSVIILNALVMLLETFTKSAESHFWFLVLNQLFTSVYSIEFVLKCYSAPIKYFTSLWNLFDFLNLILAFIDLSFTMLRADKANSETQAIFKAFRTIKAFRILRTVSFVKGLQVIVSALFFTLSNSVINVTIFILLIMFIFSIVGNTFFQQNEWKTLSSSMWTLFRYICGDEWPEIQKNIDAYPGSRIFTTFFVFIGNFIFANIFIGLIIINISDAQQENQKKLARSKNDLINSKKDSILQRQADELRTMMAKHKLEDFNLDVFESLVRKYCQHLKHDDLIQTKKLCTNLKWIRVFLQSLAHFENTMFILKNLHFEMANVLAAIVEERILLEGEKSTEDK